MPREGGLPLKISGPIGLHIRVRNKEKQFPQQKGDAVPRAGLGGQAKACYHAVVHPPAAQGLHVNGQGLSA